MKKGKDNERQITSSLYFTGFRNAGDYHEYHPVGEIKGIKRIF